MDKEQRNRLTFVLDNMINRKEGSSACPPLLDDLVRCQEFYNNCVTCIKAYVDIGLNLTTNDEETCGTCSHLFEGTIESARMVPPRQKGEGPIWTTITIKWCSEMDEVVTDMNKKCNCNGYFGKGTRAEQVKVAKTP